MHEAYKNLMEQQNPKETPAELMESLDCVPTRKMPVYKKILIAAACLCLLIPTTVLAVENIFDISIVHSGPRKDLEGNDVIGYNIDFVTEKEIPLEEIGEQWQYLEEGVATKYETWQELQTDLGYDLLDNPILEQEYHTTRSCRTFDMSFRDQGVPCTILFRSYEGQLYSFSADAAYKMGGFMVNIDTEALVENPYTPQEAKDVITAVQFIFHDESDLERFSTEEYTAASGLTATILKDSISGSDHVSYDAFFRANGVRYTVSIYGNVNNQEQTMREELIRILEAFTME